MIPSSGEITWYEVNEAGIQIAMEMTAAMAVDQIAKSRGLSPAEVLPAFMRSNTTTMLFDRATNLWICGPSYVAEEFLLH